MSTPRADAAPTVFVALTGATAPIDQLASTRRLTWILGAIRR